MGAKKLEVLVVMVLVVVKLTKCLVSACLQSYTYTHIFSCLYEDEKSEEIFV